MPCLKEKICIYVNLFAQNLVKIFSETRQNEQLTSSQSPPLFAILQKIEDCEKELEKAFAQLDRARAALGQFLLTMTVTQYEGYYARYAPRTHGLPAPVPRYEFPRGREFYKRIGEPKRIVAPMVDQSELV